MKEQFFDRLKIFTHDPFNDVLRNHSVEHSLPNCRSIDISGDFRALYEERKGVAIFVNIGIHSELY